jgi:CDP-diacylglycerol---glycerol-3-phosphate 3-phosphatidyltransferase
MAIGFFAILTYWRWDQSVAMQISNGTAAGPDWWLLLAAAVFITAALTDMLDGFLARRWQAESTFGRIMDPFADKILVVGGFVFLAGPDFWWPFPAGWSDKLSGHGLQISGIYPWMVVTILARELLVTSLRGMIESRGVRFGADVFGKLKMILQSIVIPVCLITPAIMPVLPASPQTFGFTQQPFGRTFIDLCAWSMVGLTIISGIPYVVRGVKVLSSKPVAGNKEPA